MIPTVLLPSSAFIAAMQSNWHGNHLHAFRVQQQELNVLNHTILADFPKIYLYDQNRLHTVGKKRHDKKNLDVCEGSDETA